MKFPLPAPRTQNAPVQMHLQLLYFLYIIDGAGTHMSKPTGAWMQDARAAKRPGCKRKRKWSWYSQAKGDVRGFTYCLCSPVRWFYGDNNTKWEQKSRQDDVNIGQMTGKKGKQKPEALVRYALRDTEFIPLTLKWRHYRSEGLQHFLRDNLQGEDSKGPDTVDRTKVQEEKPVQGLLRTAHWCDQA